MSPRPNRKRRQEGMKGDWGANKKHVGAWGTLGVGAKNLKKQGLYTSGAGRSRGLRRQVQRHPSPWGSGAGTCLELVPVAALSATTKESCGKASAD